MIAGDVLLDASTAAPQDHPTIPQSDSTSPPSEMPEVQPDAVHDSANPSTTVTPSSRVPHPASSSRASRPLLSSTPSRCKPPEANCKDTKECCGECIGDKCRECFHAGESCGIRRTDRIQIMGGCCFPSNCINDTCQKCSWEEGEPCGDGLPCCLRNAYVCIDQRCQRCKKEGEPCNDSSSKCCSFGSLIRLTCVNGTCKGTTP